MKVKLWCEIEADVVDSEEIESIEDSFNKRLSMRIVKRLWNEILQKTLKDICPKPTYDNKKLNIKVQYSDTEHEAQEFNLGDTAYMVDEDYSFFESTVKSISLMNGKYYYETSDIDFEFKDIGDWVFKSETYRELHLEAMI